MAKSIAEVTVTQWQHALPESVLELAGPQRLLLWAMRCWAAYHDAPLSIQGALQQAFSEAGLSTALPTFMQFMTQLFAGMKRLPDIRCVRCVKVSRDERELLRVLSEAHLSTYQESVARLALLLLPSAARASALSACELASVIERTRLCQLDSSEQYGRFGQASYFMH